jgi:hypothetical protein
MADDGNTITTPVKIQDVILGENPADFSNVSHWYTGANPNPIKVTWSRVNRVKVHEVPIPEYKTIKTSVRTLYTCQMNFKTIKRVEIFDKLLKYCEDKVLVTVETAHKKLPMYIMDYSYVETASYDDDYIEWNITFQEMNDGGSGITMNAGTNQDFSSSPDTAGDQVAL